MPLQLGANFVVAVKAEATYSTDPGSTGATQMRVVDSPGLTLQMAEIKSARLRADWLDTMARMGSRTVTGGFTTAAIVGSHDLWYEAAMRATWVPPVAITHATAGLTSITTTTSTIVAAAGSWSTAGVRVGDVVRLTGHSTAANNSINLRVKAVSALTLTLHGTPLIADAVADTTFTLTIWKKLSNPAQPVRRTFSVEQRDVDIDSSVLFGGVRYTSMTVTGSRDGMAIVEFGAMGGGVSTIITGTSSPYFTTPTAPNGTPLTFADAVISLGGSDVVNLTAFQLNYSIASSTVAVIGSPYSPDVFDGRATLSGSISAPRSDLARFAASLAETEYELHALLVEPEAEPKDGIAFYIPRIKFTGVGSTLGGDGAKIESMPFTCGVKHGAGATGYDSTLLTISTSAA